MGWLLLKTAFSLAGVLALMLAVIWLLKRSLADGRRGSSGIVEVEVLAQKSLQPKRSVVVLKVLNKVLVVGSSDEGLRTLAEIDDDDVLRELTAARIQQETGFGGLIRRSDAMQQSPSFAAALAASIDALRQRLSVGTAVPPFGMRKRMRRDL